MHRSPFRADLLVGKGALVTGGGSGIGEGIARARIQYGARAAILGRSEDRLRDVAKLLSDQTGSRCIAAPADVRDPAAVERAVDETLSRHRRLDIVVNAAAGNFLAPAAALSYNGFRTVMEIDA